MVPRGAIHRKRTYWQQFAAHARNGVGASTNNTADAACVMVPSMLNRLRTFSSVIPFSRIRFSKEPMMNGNQIPMVPYTHSHAVRAMPTY